MICYKCGTQAGKAGRCPACGADLKLFWKALHISNAYYNDGLLKAQVRNLSGAIISLKASLKFHKFNTDARNLLGLIYYEMGETVDALSEWVISKSYQPQNNRASVYLDNLQKNQAEFGAINQTIKKYNQALQYCRQDSRDLAIIQLKKVLSLNPNLVKGHQLLALLYLQEGKLEQAKKSLRAAGKIDTNNTTTLRYLKEVNAQLRENSGKKKDASDDLISYQSGNETIIMPKRFKESSLGSTIAYLIIGLVIGLAATCWLIVPKVKKEAQYAASQQLLAANETISTNEQTISNMEAQLEELRAELGSFVDHSGEYQEQIDDIRSRILCYEQLMDAYALYQDSKVEEAEAVLDELDITKLNASAKVLYQSLSEDVDVLYLAKLYQDGYAAYGQGDYDTSIRLLQTIADADMDYEKGSCAYYLAQSYRKSGNAQKAKPYYQFVIDHYPDSQRAANSRKYV